MRCKQCRCVLLVEFCEESGSNDLEHYIQKLESQIGTPSLCVCLDSGMEDGDHIWLTTSLRGVANGVLKVEVLKQAIHSGHR